MRILIPVFSMVSYRAPLSDHGMRRERRSKHMHIHDSKQGIIASSDKELLINNHLEVFEKIKRYVGVRDARKS